MIPTYSQILLLILLATNVFLQSATSQISTNFVNSQSELVKVIFYNSSQRSYILDALCKQFNLAVL